MLVSEQRRGLRTWIEVSRANLEHNYQVFRKQLRTDCKLLGVAKSNAYGHNLIEYAQSLESLGADFIGVDSVLEAFKLREAGIKAPLLVLGYTLPENILAACEQNISLSVSSMTALEDLLTLGDLVGLKLHLKFDTGMCRQGFFADDADLVLDWLANNLPSVIIEGVYTHFAGAKNPAFPAGTNQQIQKFEMVLNKVNQRGLKVIRHACATSGAIVFPEAHYDMVRIGIGLMGLWPSKEVQYAFAEKIDLRPILAWRTVVSELKSVPAGSRVGYDFTELLERDTRLAILPVGYWHGYDRSLSSLGRVVIGGHRTRVLGRVSMDMIVVDVTDVPVVNVGDQATLIGIDGNAEVTAEEVASLSDTSHYETVTRLNPLIKRIYV